MLVLPVPGGPHRIIEASLPAATIRPIAPSGPVRCSCPTTSSSDVRAQPVGERRIGRAARRRRGRAAVWSANRSAIARLIIGGRKIAPRSLVDDAAKIYLRHIERENKYATQASWMRPARPI